MIHQKRLPILVAVLSGVFVILSIVDWVLENSNQQEQLWIQVKTNNSIERLQQYINSDGVHKDKAVQFLAELKQDMLDFENAVLAQTEEAMIHYLSNCSDSPCAYKDAADEVIFSITKIAKNFEIHLENNQLDSGESGFALADLEELQRLLPQDKRVYLWTERIAEKYYYLSEHAFSKKQSKKAKLYLKKASNLSDKFKNNNLLRDILKADRKALERKIAQSSKDLDKLLFEYKSCRTRNCPKYITVLRSKIISYQKLKQTISAKIKSQRLTTASKYIKQLKDLFPEAIQIEQWNRQVSDGFYKYAKNEANPDKSLVYINKALRLTPNHPDLISLRAEINKKIAQDAKEKKVRLAMRNKEKELQKTQIKKNQRQSFLMDDGNKYKQVLWVGTIQAMKHYVDNCDFSCPNYEQAQDRLVQSEMILDDFELHIKQKELLNGSFGFALLDLKKLKKLFPKDNLAKRWERVIISTVLAQIKQKIQKKQYSSAHTQIERATKIYTKNTKLAKLLKSIKDKNVGKNNHLVPELVYIKGGGFTMGSKIQYSNPKRWVKVKPFSIGKTEVTFNQFKQYARKKSIKLNTGSWGGKNRPVINISWSQALGYTKWLSKKTNRIFRLPSEAEWEFVAQNSQLMLSKQRINKSWVCKYANGADLDTKLPWKNRQCQDGFDEKTAPVKSFKPNKFGVYDMHGNVWEWTADCWHNSFKNAPKSSKPWVNKGNCSRRVIKGGGWNSSVLSIFPSYRSSALRNLEYNYVGFRIVEDIK